MRLPSFDMDPHKPSGTSDDVAVQMRVEQGKAAEHAAKLAAIRGVRQRVAESQPTLAEIGMQELQNYLNALHDSAGNRMELKTPCLPENDPSTKFALGYIKICLGDIQFTNDHGTLYPNGWWAKDGDMLSPQGTGNYLHNILFDCIHDLNGCAAFHIGDNSKTVAHKPSPLELEFAIVTCTDMDAVRERMYDIHDRIHLVTGVRPVVSVNSNEMRWVQGMDLTARLKVLRNFSNFACTQAGDIPYVFGMDLQSYQWLIESFPEPEGLTPDQLAVLQREKQALVQIVGEYLSGVRKFDVSAEATSSVQPDFSNVVRLDVWRTQQQVMHTCNRTSDNLRGIQVA